MRSFQKCEFSKYRENFLTSVFHLFCKNLLPTNIFSCLLYGCRLCVSWWLVRWVQT